MKGNGPHARPGPQPLNWFIRLRIALSAPLPPRVLVVLGNLALNGQERGNIEVFNATKTAGVEALFVTHRDWGHYHIQPFLDRLGIRWTTLEYARHFTKNMGLRRWGRNVGRLVTGSWAFWKTMRAYRPTHIHVANPHYYLCVLPALLMTRTPIVYRLGDEPIQHHALYRALWRWGIVPRVQTFVCVSEHIRAKAIESGVPRDKTKVIYTHPASRPAPEPLDLPGFDGRTVTYVGQIAPHKGVDVFVEAAMELCRALDDVRFLIAGAVSRTNPFALALFANVQAAGLADRIRFMGYVQDVPSLLAASDLHVCPSVGPEALSNTVVEAKLAGVASVVSASGGLPELITQDVDGRVCDPVTPQTLRETILDLLALSDRDLEAAGRAARTSMTRLGITAEVFTARWAEIYGMPVLAAAPQDKQVLPV